MRITQEDATPQAGLSLEPAHQADAGSKHADPGCPGAKDKVQPPHHRSRVSVPQANTRQRQKNTDTQQRAAGRNEKKAKEFPNELESIGQLHESDCGRQVGGCLETLVPIVGALTGDEHEDARNWQMLGRRDVALGDSGARQAVSSPEARACK